MDAYWSVLLSGVRYGIMAEKWQNSAVLVQSIAPDRISACVCPVENPLLTERHRVVTFQDGLIDMLERHARKGRLVHAEGKLQTRRWKKDGEDSARFSTEILIVPGHKIQFLDKPAGANGNGAQAAAEPANGEAMPAGGAPAQTDDPGSDDFPF